MKKYEVDVIELRKKMLENNIFTISELAEKLNLSSSTVSRILNKKQRPSTDVIEKLIIVLGIKENEAGEIFFKEELA